MNCFQVPGTNLREISGPELLIPLGILFKRRKDEYWPMRGMYTHAMDT
jgi:hypothetical protein